jgi:hypothetical protein
VLCSVPGPRVQKQIHVAEFIASAFNAFPPSFGFGASSFPSELKQENGHGFAARFGVPFYQV